MSIVRLLGLALEPRRRTACAVFRGEGHPPALELDAQAKHRELRLGATTPEQIRGSTETTEPISEIRTAASSRGNTQSLVAVGGARETGGTCDRIQVFTARGGGVQG